MKKSKQIWWDPNQIRLMQLLMDEPEKPKIKWDPEDTSVYPMPYTYCAEYHINGIPVAQCKGCNKYYPIHNSYLVDDNTDKIEVEVLNYEPFHWYEPLDYNKRILTPGYFDWFYIQARRNPIGYNQVAFCNHCMNAIIIYNFTHEQKIYFEDWYNWFYNREWGYDALCEYVTNEKTSEWDKMFKESYKYFWINWKNVI